MAWLSSTIHAWDVEQSRSASAGKTQQMRFDVECRCRTNTYKMDWLQRLTARPWCGQMMYAKSSLINDTSGHHWIRHAREPHGSTFMAIGVVSFYTLRGNVGYSRVRAYLSQRSRMSIKSGFGGHTASRRGILGPGHYLNSKSLVLALAHFRKSETVFV